MRLRPVLTRSVYLSGCVSALCVSFLAASLTSCTSGSTSAVQLTAVTAPEESMLPVTVMATSNASGSVVTFGVAGTATGSFSPATCTIANGSCSVSYMPTGSLAAGTYAGDVTASFAKSGNYLAESATSTLTINASPTYTFDLLASFTGASGAYPGADPPQNSNFIQGSDGNFYGVTQAAQNLEPRGTSGYGAAYKITSSGAFTLLHTFAGGTSDGWNPEGSLVEGSDGNFYGVTSKIGSNEGTVYRMTPSGQVTVLHIFTGAASDGENPLASLIQGSDGSFYGTTEYGGTSGYGTVYKITPSGSFTLLYSFPSITDSEGNFSSEGSDPSGSLVEGSDGNFYGMTGFGGANGWGTVYQVTPSGAFTLLHTFARVADNGMYGFGNLIQGSDGKFYGMAGSGGASDAGIVFTITPSGSFTLVYSFTGTNSDGGGPGGSLVEGSDGNFYGMAEGVTIPVYGTVFQMTPSGSVTLLHSFTGADGKFPYGSLVEGSDGSLYGFTSRGGASDDGTLFKLVSSPPLPGQVSITVPASVTHGTAFTLGYANINAANTAGVTVAGPTTQQGCVATNYLSSDTTYTPVDTTGWVGAKTAAMTVTNVPLTAPATAGTYTYALTCGGVESGFATLNVQ
ncbi:MAG: choice-of-anchor tandem repeat GloVer-containing protein [Acidobacteriaceae bacterium]